MELSYTFFYVESNIVCLFIFALLLVRSIGGVDRQEKQRVFDSILISHMAYFISDIIWVLILGGTISKTDFSVAAVSISNALFLNLLTFFWFMYVELSQGEEYVKVVYKRFMLFSPSVVLVLVMTVLFITKPDLMLESDLHEPTAVYYLLFLSIPILFIVAATIRSFQRAFRKENLANRRMYLACAMYPLGVSAFGIMQTLWLKAPLFCFGCTITMIYVYIESLENQVSIDPLTKLNNRSQLKRYISAESVSLLYEEKPVSYVLMMDLNKFKSINDKYGHIEGDMAIVRAADALRKACSGSRTRPFIARYGGDEFIIVARTDDTREVVRLCENIKAKLSELNKEAGVAYELTASIGYARFDGDPGNFQAAVKAADEALYKEKEALKKAVVTP